MLRRSGFPIVCAETAALPAAAAGVAASVEQLDRLARARADDLQVARGVGRQRDRVAGHEFFWYKQSVHGKSIPHSVGLRLFTSAEDFAILAP